MTGHRTAMITGASRGIGRAIALALAEDGYDVAITPVVRLMIVPRPRSAIERSAGWVANQLGLLPAR